MAYKSNFAKILNRIEAEVKGEVRVQVEALQTEAESLIREPKTGRVYMHPQPAPHVASNEEGGTSPAGGGEPWANWTGATASTFEAGVRDNGFTGVFSSSGVSFWLEYGTENMEPRPLHRPILDNRTQPILSGLAAALKRGTS